MSLIKTARSELRAAGLFDPDADYDGAVATTVMALMETFVAYGQSGESARQVLTLFKKLADHEPITPLTGDDTEWDDRSKENGSPMWQNNRYGLVFKDKERAWRVFEGQREPETITFPYTV